MKLVKVVALGSFATSDASGVISAKAGDTLEVSEYTAKRLVQQRLVRKVRITKKKDEE